MKNKFYMGLFALLFLLALAGSVDAHTMTLSGNELLAKSNEKIAVTIQLTDSAGQPLPKSGVLTSLYTYACSVHPRWQQKYTDSAGKAVYEIYNNPYCSSISHYGIVKIRGQVYYTYGPMGGDFYDFVKVVGVHSSGYNPPNSTPPTCTPNWVCGAYTTACISGTQTRTCNDGCGNTRTESRGCVVIPGDTDGNGNISLNELLAAITLWQNGGYNDSQLIAILRAYVGAA